MTPISTPPPAIVREIKEIEAEQAKLRLEQQKLESHLHEVSEESKSLSAAVKALDSTRKKILTDLNLTETRIESSNFRISSITQNIQSKEREISIHREAISQAIEKLVEYDRRPFIYTFLASSGIAEAWDDRVTFAKLSGELKEQVEVLRGTKTALESEKKVKAKSVSELEQLQQELDGQKDVVEESKRAQEKLLKETKNKEAEYARLLAENIARQEEAEAELFKLESSLDLEIDPAGYPVPRAGMLAWPLDKVFITQRFGRTVGAARLYASGSHNGADFRAAMGTPVKAMLAGTVEGAGNTDEQRGCYSYGRWILIRHDNGLSSVYAHLSASFVKPGQRIDTGQVIGYSGGMPRTSGAGFSTGPHLHVGLFATQGVAIRQFTDSKNCKLVSIPLADPSAYLDPLAYLPAL